jgi:hypothetical protein
MKIWGDWSTFFLSLSLSLPFACEQKRLPCEAWLLLLFERSEWEQSVRAIIEGKRITHSQKRWKKGRRNRFYYNVERFIELLLCFNTNVTVRNCIIKGRFFFAKINARCSVFNVKNSWLSQMTQKEAKFIYWILEFVTFPTLSAAWNFS